MNGNYEDVISRLRTERLVQKFVLKFLEDDSYDLLIRSMESENYEEAFRASHTIKGMCQNLSFTQLGGSSAQLTEALRNGVTPEAPGLLETVKTDYEKTAEAIRAFQAGLSS